MTDGRDTGARRVFWSAFAVLSLLGISWSLTSPLMSVPDEPAHAIRAASVARLQFDPPTAPLDGDFGHANGTVSTVSLPLPYGALHTMPLCLVFRHEAATCLEPLPPPLRVVDTRTTAGTYPPVYYAIVGWPSLLLSAEPAVYAMRILSALAAAALFAVGLASLVRQTGSRLAVAVALAAITPMAVFLAGSVNPNGFEIAAAFAFWAGGLALLGGTTPPDRAAVLRVAVPAGLLAWSRPLSPAFGVAILVVLVVAVGTRERWRELATSPTVRRGVVATTVVSVLAGVWVLVNDSLGSFNGTGDPTLTTRSVLSQSWHLTNYRIDQLIGQLGWLEARLPGEVLVAWQLTVVPLLLLALVFGRWRERLALVGIALTVLALPLASELNSADTIGFAWQGRYSLPIAVGGLVLAGSILGRRFATWSRADAWLAAVVVLPLAGAHVGAHAASMRRYVEATITPLFSYLDEVDAWQAPLGNTTLLVLTATAALGLLVPVLVAQPRRRDPAAAAQPPLPASVSPPPAD